LHQIQARLSINVRQTRALAAPRDTVLPKLLSGAIRVGQAKRVVEEVL